MSATLLRSELRSEWVRRRSPAGYSGLFSSQMQELNGEEVATLLEGLGIDLLPACSAGLCHAQIRPLWPTDVALMSVRLPSSEIMPAWHDILIDFGDSARGVLLDGTGPPIIGFFRALPHDGAQISDPLEALEYAELFSSLISGPGGTFRLVGSPRDLLPQIRLTDRDKEEIEEAANLLGDPPQIYRDFEVAGTWEIVTQMVHDGRIFRARLRIGDDFTVSMLEDEALTAQLPLARDLYLNGVRVRLGTRP